MIDLFVMPPSLEKLKGRIALGLSVRPCVRSKCIKIQLKYHIWIPHQIEKWHVFFVRIISLCGVMPLLKGQNDIL